MIARRWPLYLTVCAGTIALQAIFLQFVHVKFAEFYALLVGAPLVNAFVMVNVGADAAGTLSRFSDRIERILERTWAVIVIDAGITLSNQVGFSSLASGDTGAIVMGGLVVYMGAMLVYAEPFTCLETQTQSLTLVPLALLRSMMLAWVNGWRILALLVVQLALAVGQLELVTLTAGSKATTLIEVAYVTLTSALAAALFAVAYLDTLAKEQAS